MSGTRRGPSVVVAAVATVAVPVPPDPAAPVPGPHAPYPRPVIAFTPAGATPIPGGDGDDGPDAFVRRLR